MSALRGRLRALRARLAARPDTEHEQAIVRLLVSALLVLYLAPLASGLERDFALYIGGTHFMVGVLVLLSILGSTQSSPARRAVAIFADFSTVTCYMVYFGETAAPLLLLYVWMTLANGFRFGKNYLMVSLLMGVSGFSVVLWQSDFWLAHRGMGYGLMVAFIALSLYVQSLVTKLFDAIARAEAANEAKRRFISVVSHEMRTPLNAIIGMADLLRDTSLNREQADMLQTLRSSSRAMLGLVDDVLDFSKIEAGKLVLEKADFDLHALVNSSCRIVAAQAAAKGIELVVSIMPEVPPALRGDPHHLRQVLINLAGNAVKFTERGSVTVHVSSQEENDSSVLLKFSIRDTGIGIAPEAQARIFESFSQADQSTTRRFGGTGLGTTIAKQLVALMRGRIGVESALGLGSTFWFELRLEKQPERASLGAGELAGRRVLVVGFPAAEREALVDALTGWGVAPVAVDDVGQAVSRLVAEISVASPYHSVVLYGYQGDQKLAQHFRRAAPSPAPPIVVAVPREAGVSRFEALSSGFAAVLELPFDKRQLFNVLHSVAAAEEVPGEVVRLQDYAQRGSKPRRLRVLAVDDNPTNREVIGKILERGGHAVTLAGDGDEALDLLEAQPFDVAILDRNMPGMGGIDTLRALLVTTLGHERPAVVILSADVTAEARREALEAGADAFLGKPIEAVRLLSEIQALSTTRKSAPHPEPAAPRPARPADAAVIDREVLADLEELGAAPGFLEKLIGIYIADTTAQLGRAEGALGTQNYGEFRSLLHAIKGSSASIGTNRLSRVCDGFGKLSDPELRLQTPAVLRSLGEELGAARAELARYLSERRQSAG